MRFAIVHDWVTAPGGSEEVLREVLELFPGVLFTSQCDRARHPWLEKTEIRTSYVQNLPLALSKHYIYAPLVAHVYPKFDLSEFDVVLSDSHSFAHGVRKRPDALHINYYHTPARSLWVPEVDGRAQGGLKQLLIPHLKRLDLEAAKRPDILFANSKTTADRVAKFYGRKVDQVIYPPVRTEQFLRIPRKADDAGYVMWGRLIPYKRIDLGIHAARELQTTLNIVGAGPQEAELKALAQGNPYVKFWGRLPFDELSDLLSRCRGIFFPGYEDFGIVPVEAMAAGLPVVAYGAGGVSESVTENCGVLFREQTVPALVQAVRLLEHQRFEEQALRARAREFDIDVFRKTYKSATEAAIARHFSGVKGAQ